MSEAAAGPELSVVIPTLDEIYALPKLVAGLRGQDGVELEIIVADGGSRDGTPERARELGVTLVTASRGRATQMNAGAASARAPLLLFLHADSEFTSSVQLREALATLRAARERGGDRIAGHFALRFARRSLGHALFYRYLEEKSGIL